MEDDHNMTTENKEAAKDLPSAMTSTSEPVATSAAKPAADVDQAEGHNEPTSTTEQDSANGDIKMKDAEAAGDADVTATNGTPLASEKKKDTPRRKSTGVPEHKTKKLNRKKSKAEFHPDAKPGELYLARMKGHPAWPSIIADDDMLPEAISKSRPVTAPNPDGSWRRDDYAPGGKRHNERTFAIMFLHTNEFAWIPNSDLTPITAEECKDVSEKNKSKLLLGAYQEAGEGHSLAHYKGLLDDHANAVAEEEQARAEREAEKARKAEKKAKRKSEAAAADDDVMDVDDNGEAKAKSKKRKKEADGDEDGKTPKTTKLKLSTPKTPTTGEKAAKKKEGTAKSGKKKSAAKAGSDNDTGTPAEDKEPLTEQQKHDKLREEIRYCRHKLQRTLIGDNRPTDDEVKACEPFLKRLENYPDLAADIIAHTKIHKLLKAIIKIPSVPLDEELNIKKRSSQLLAGWSKILAENPQAVEKKDEKKDATTNGETKPESTENKNDDDKKVNAEGDEKIEGAKEEKHGEAKESNTENSEPIVKPAPEKATVDGSEEKGPTGSEPSKADEPAGESMETD